MFSVTGPAPVSTPVVLLLTCTRLLIVSPPGLVTRMPPLANAIVPIPVCVPAPPVVAPPIPRRPELIVKVPENVFAPVRYHTPFALTLTASAAPPLSVRLELIVFASLLVPRSVSVFAMEEELIRLPSTSGPLPSAEMVVPAVRLNCRMLVSPGPV